MAVLSQRLLNGYLLFKKMLNLKNIERYTTLAETGQNPDIMIIACCDSRVAPEVIFNTMPGEIFVVRNISNLVPPYCPDSSYHSTSAALEYGVCILNVKQILVLGHEDCGGITKVLGKEKTTRQGEDFVNKWLSLIKPLSLPLKNNDNLNISEKSIILEQRSLMQSITNLRSFPWIVQREQKGALQLNAAWFSIKNSELWVLDEQQNMFLKIENT